MSTIKIPVRYYKDYEGGYDYGYEDLLLPSDKCAFLLVDVDYVPPMDMTEKNIAPALAAARKLGLKVAYVHNDLRLVADEGNIVHEIWGKTKGGSGIRNWMDISSFKPQYPACVTPIEGERNFPKWIWSGFRDTFLDQHLKAHDIKTLFVVGYSQRACLHYTIADAVGLNYRVILLRDCAWAPEMPDTIDETLPEGGWINRITLRNIEHLIGYTTTSGEFIKACSDYLAYLNSRDDQ